MIFIINRSRNHVTRSQNKLFKYRIKRIGFEVKRTMQCGQKGRANLPCILFQHVIVALVSTHSLWRIHKIICPICDWIRHASVKKLINVIHVINVRSWSKESEHNLIDILRDYQLPNR